MIWKCFRVFVRSTIHCSLAKGSEACYNVGKEEKLHLTLDPYPLIEYPICKAKCPKF